MRLLEFDDSKYADYDDDFEYLAEMASAGYLKLIIGLVELRVNPHEGMIPHFHLRIVGKKLDDIRIRLDKPEYLIHSDNPTYLNSKDRRTLYNHLIAEDAVGSTKWKFMRDAWNNLYPDRKVLLRRCPNYCKLPNKTSRSS